MAIQFNTIAREKMGDKVDKFCIFNVNDDVNHRAFSIDFEAYNYFVIRLNYDKGRFGCNIIFGEKLKCNKKRDHALTFKIYPMEGYRRI